MTSFSSIRSSLELTESEDTWDKIANAIAALKTCVHDDGSDQDPELVPFMRSVARPFVSAMNSERSRLSGVAIDTLASIAAALGRQFDALVPLLFPPLLALCARPSKIILARAQKAIQTIIESTQLPSLLPYFLDSSHDKSANLRSACAQGTLACLNSFNPPDIEKETRAHQIESLIRVAGGDASASVRQVAKQMYKAYQELLPGRTHAFDASLSPTTKKTLGVTSSASSSRPTSQAARPRSVAAIARKPDSKLSCSTSAVPPKPRPQSSMAHTRSASSDVQAQSSSNKPSKRAMPPPDFVPQKNVLPTRTVARPPSAPNDAPKRFNSSHGVPRHHPSDSDHNEQPSTSSLSSSRSGPVRIPKHLAASDHDAVVTVARKVPLPADEPRSRTASTNTSLHGPTRAPISKGTSVATTGSRTIQRKPPIPVLEGSKPARVKASEPIVPVDSSTNTARSGGHSRTASSASSRPGASNSKAPEAPKRPTGDRQTSASIRPPQKLRSAPEVTRRKVPDSTSSSNTSKEPSSRPAWGARLPSKKTTQPEATKRSQPIRAKGVDKSGIPRVVDATKVPLPPSPSRRVNSKALPEGNLAHGSEISQVVTENVEGSIDGSQTHSPLLEAVDLAPESLSPEMDLNDEAEVSPTPSPVTQPVVADTVPNNETPEPSVEGEATTPEPFPVEKATASLLPSPVIQVEACPSTPKQSSSLAAPEPTPISRLVASIEQGFLVDTPAPTPRPVYPSSSPPKTPEESASTPTELTPVNRTPLQALAFSDFRLSPIVPFPGAGAKGTSHTMGDENQPYPEEAYYMDPPPIQSELSMALERFHAGDGW